MLFNSPFFLFCFIPLFFLVYWLSKEKYRNLVILSGSIFFYAWGAPKFIFVVLFSAFFDWKIGNYLSKNHAEYKKLFLIISILANVLILVYFKYTNFFIDNINKTLSFFNYSTFIIEKIALPIGVSFIVFEKITYVTDIYKGLSPAKNFVSYLVYVFLFPKLLAGPIIKYHDIADQLNERDHNLEDIYHGIIRFSAGLAKKVFIADTMAEVSDDVFALAPNDLGLFNAWLGALCFTLQIYFDFSSYSDMAIGLTRIMGFHILENFNMPYISGSFTEFWRRWHISLSTWIRDYLYIPLGGSRSGKKRTYFNLWLCFLISGLWHGANWTFILWGIYHGFFLIIERIFLLRIKDKFPKFINILLTFFLIVIGWVMFRAGNIGYMTEYMTAMFNFSEINGHFIYITNNIRFFLFLGVFICFIPMFEFYDNIIKFYKKSSVTIQLLAAFVLLIFSIGKISTTTFNPFLYFRF